MATDYNALFANPWLQMGLGILSQNRPGASFGEAVGRGGLLGMANLQQQQLLAQKQAQLAAEQQREQQQRELQAQWIAQNMPQIAGAPQFVQQEAIKSQFREPDLPSGMRMGPSGPEWIPGYLEAQERLRAAGAPSVSVGGSNVYLPKQMTEEAKVVGKAFGEDFIETQKAARSAMSDNAKLDRLSALLEQTYTGAGGQAVQSAKRAAQVLGIDISGVGEAEAATALANEMALQLRNPAGGAGMPGALSDKDREFLVSMVPQLTTTPEGRRLMIETKRKLNQRNVEVGRMAREYRQKNGALDEGFYDILQTYSDANLLFADMARPKQQDKKGAIPVSPKIEALLNKYPGR